MHPNGTRRSKEKEFRCRQLIDSIQEEEKNFKLYNPNVNIYIKKTKFKIKYLLRKEFFNFCLVARKKIQ